MTRVEWVHPSVRDLVIDYLSTHDADRAAFLRTASPAGLVLALSTAGGTAGDRALPLLRTRNDWDSIAERASEVVASGGLADLYKLLEAFGPAVRHSRARRDATHVARVVTQALGALCARWDSAEEPIPLVLLRPYLVVSEATTPLVAVPDLRATWERETTRTGLTGEAPDAPTQDDLLNIDGWLQLASLVAQYEPRFLRQVRFAERYHQPLAVLVGAVEVWLSEVVIPQQEYDAETGEPYGLSAEDEETEATLFALDDPLRKVASLFPSLASQSSVLAEQCTELRNALAEVEREREDWHEQRAEEALDSYDSSDDDDDDDDQDDDDDESPDPTIDQLFADL